MIMVGNSNINVYNTSDNYSEVYDRLPDIDDSIIEQYSDTIASTEVPFSIDTFVDDFFGGFKNEIFYDYLKFFCIMIFIIFCIKIFGIFFEN